MGWFTSKEEKKQDNMERKKEILQQYKTEVNRIFCNTFEKISESGISTNDISIIHDESCDIESYLEDMEVGMLSDLAGIIIDRNQRKIAVFKIYNISFKNYLNGEMGYKCEIMDIEELLSVDYKVNETTTYSATVTSQNVLKRVVVGTVLAGEVGAVIGGVTAKKKVDIIPQTNTKEEIILKFDNEVIPMIKFEKYNMYLTNYDKLVNSNKNDYIRCHVVNDSFCHMAVKGLDSSPVFNEKNEFIKEHDLFDEVRFASDGIMEIIATNIGGVIEHLKSEQKNKLLENDDIKKSNYSMAEEIRKLLELKEKGFLNEEEFTSIKNKLIGSM